MAKIIVEVCQNHNGDKNLLREMLYAAKEGGADVAKGQIIFAEDLTRRERFDEGLEEENGVRKTIKRPYGAEFERLQKLDLKEEDYVFFVEEAKRLGITPMLTVFNRSRVPFAASLPWGSERMVKVASYDCASVPLVSELANHFDKFVVSTGATFDEEIAKTAQLLNEQNKRFAFLHCVTSYPNTLGMANLSRMQWLRQFTSEVGWSDHTLVARDGIKAAKVALMLGADYVERHFTILPPEQTKDGPVSINPQMLRELAAFAKLPQAVQFEIVEREIPEWRMLIGTPQRDLTHVEMLNRDYYRGRFASRSNGQWIFNWDIAPLARSKETQPEPEHEREPAEMGMGMFESVYELVPDLDRVIVAEEPLPTISIGAEIFSVTQADPEPARHPFLERIDNRVFIIAEIGKNFIQTEQERPVEEYLENAKALVRTAKAAGADAVKFQTHNVEDEQLNINVVSPHFKGSDRHSWVTRNTNATPLETFWKPLKQHCDNLGILFFSTPMSRGAAQKLDKVGVDLWKVGSGDILDFVMLDYIAAAGKPIIFSAGMSTLEELDKTVDFLRQRNVPMVLLHCVSKYPCPPEDLHLSSIEFLRNRYGMPVGFSDHSIGIDSALAAVALGARVVEKHFSFSRALWGADHKVSMTPEELQLLVDGIRALEQDPAKKAEYLQKDIVAGGMGTGGKVLQDDEAVFRPYFRKSLMAGRDIAAGERIIPDMLYAMRPQQFAGGLPSEEYERVLGKHATRALKKYDPITREKLEIRN